MKKLKEKLLDSQKLLNITQNDSLKRLMEAKKITKKLTLLRRAVFRYVNLRKDDNMFYFYAGITHPVFKWLLEFCPKPKVSRSLSVEDHLLLLLVKLRMGLTNRDLGYRFQISQSMVSRCLRTWLPKLSKFMVENL